MLDLLMAYLANCVANGFTAASVYTYETSIRMFLGFTCTEDADPVQITPTIVESWRNQMIERGNSVSTIILRLTALRAFFEYCVQMNAMQHNPVKDALMPSAPKPVCETEDASALDPDEMDFMGDYSHTLTLEQYAELLSPDRPRNHSVTNFLRDRALVAVALTCGLRASELASLKPMHVDFERGFLLVYAGKGGKTAPVPLLPLCAQYIREYLEACPMERTEPMFGMGDRRIVSARIMTYVRQCTGVEDARAHALRHGLDVILKADAVPDDIREEIMRHAASRPLDRRYAGRTPMKVMQEYQHRAFDKILGLDERKVCNGESRD